MSASSLGLGVGDLRAAVLAKQLTWKEEWMWGELCWASEARERNTSVLNKLNADQGNMAVGAVHALLMVMLSLVRNTAPDQGLVALATTLGIDGLEALERGRVKGKRVRCETNQREMR